MASANAVSIWPEIREKIERQTTPQQFATWFRNLALEEVTDSKVVFSVPSRFHRDWIVTYYREHVERAVAEVLGSPRPIHLDVVPRDPAEAAAPRRPARTTAGVAEGGSRGPGPSRTESRDHPPGTPRPATARMGPTSRSPRGSTSTRLVVGLQSPLAAGGRPFDGTVGGRRLRAPARGRRHRARQDPPAPGDRPRRHGAADAALRGLRPRRELRPRLHAGDGDGRLGEERGVDAVPRQVAPPRLRLLRRHPPARRQARHAAGAAAHAERVARPRHARRLRGQRRAGRQPEPRPRPARAHLRRVRVICACPRRHAARARARESKARGELTTTSFPSSPICPRRRSASSRARSRASPAAG